MSTRAGYQSLDGGDAMLGPGADVEAGVTLGAPATDASMGQPAPPQPPAATAMQPAPSPPAQPARFPLRILDTQGRLFTVDADSSQATVAALKEKVAAATSVEPALQRLIFCGKMLTDGQKLEDVGIVAPDVTVHLFARPAPPAGGSAAAGAAGGVPGAAGGVPGAAGGAAGAGPGAGGWMPGFGDPELIRSTHSVRLLSSCLVAVCTMQLLLLFLRLMAQWQGMDNGQQQPGDDDSNAGKEPANVENSNAMLFLQVLMNVMGLYVGLAGVRSANTLSLQTAKTYFFGLVAVGTLWLSLRVIWAIQSVNLGYDADIGPQPGGGGGPPSGSDNGTQPGGDEDGGGGIQQMDRSELMYMVTLSCMIYVCVWSVCFLRAATFYNLLRASHGAPTATA